MAYLNQFSRITIGDLVFKNIDRFEIHESVTDIGDKATITLPRNYKELNGKKVLDFIRPGDAVLIEAGYNGELHNEFTGYVADSITADIPLEIACDQVYPLRQNNIRKSYKDVTLKQLLTENIIGYKIDCPDVKLGKLLVDDLSSFQLLEKLLKGFGFYTRIYNGNILHVGWAYDWKPTFTNKVTYTFALNVKNAKKLKFKHKDDFKTRIKITIIHPTGKKEIVIVGDKDKKAAVTPLTIFNKTKDEATQIGNARYKKVVYDGFDGTVVGYGIPRVHAGDSVEFISIKFPERNGSYIAEKVDIKYEESGLEREIKIGFKL